jgi:hypothetical protein
MLTITGHSYRWDFIHIAVNIAIKQIVASVAREQVSAHIPTMD